jgi:hypothetical protein
MPESELLQELFRDATGAAAAVDPNSVRAAGPINIAPKGGQEFLTPSGKLEFYAESLAAKGLAPCPIGTRILKNNNKPRAGRFACSPHPDFSRPIRPIPTYHSSGGAKAFRSVFCIPRTRACETSAMDSEFGFLTISEKLASFSG